MQAYWVMQTWDVKEKEFHQKINIALFNVAKEMEKLGGQLPTYNLINQISSNYYVVNINDIINPNNLEYFLQKELEEVGLNEDFEYGIYDCANDKMVYGNYFSYSPKHDQSKHSQVELPTYDEYIYYFGVRFPNRSNHLLRSMPLTISFSVILFVVISFFTYSIFVILRQKRLSEMQKDFINNMTHEFKTPISTIGISADVFIKEKKIQTDKRLLRYAQIIKGQNQRLNNQVEKVLQLARIEKDNFKLKLEEIHLHELLGDVVQSTLPKAQERGGYINLETVAGVSPVVTADCLHLTNILYNLLDNALKYCKSKPEISVISSLSGNKIRLKVVDNGIGIKKEHLTKVFDKFYRVPTGNVHDVKGFGLGLFYVKNVCDVHDWKIFIESSAGKGSTVTIIMKAIK